eukprot:scaffold105873_cov28-Phaeocystis_antarctica.AAC.1
MVPPTKQNISAGRLLGAGRAGRWPRLPRCASDLWRFLQRAPIALAQPSGALDPHLCSTRLVSVRRELYQK